MKTVRDDDGTHYLLLKRSGEASLVRDPETGNECYVGNDRLEDADDISPLETSARAIPDPVRAIVRTAHDDRSLGLLVELADRGPLSVRTLLSNTAYCESDLSGLLATLAAAGVITEVEVDDERGYELAEESAAALARLREPTAE